MPHINRLQLTFQISILDYVVQTIFYKFVTVGRKDETVATDRVFLVIVLRIELKIRMIYYSINTKPAHLCGSFG